MHSDLSLALNGTTIAAGGVAASVLLLALVERLRRTFATRQDLDALGERLRALEGACREAREAAEEVCDRLGETQREHRLHGERLVEQWLRPLERAVERLEAAQTGQAAHAALLSQLARRFPSSAVAALGEDRLPAP